MNKMFYNNFFAAGHHHDWRDAPGKLVVLGYIMDNIKEQSSLLDIGCGDGYLINRISNEAKNRDCAVSCIGIDISDEAIRIASENYASIKFDVMDAQDMKFDQAEFEVVVSYGVFEHLSHPAVSITEASRVLRKGGYLR